MSDYVNLGSDGCRLGVGFCPTLSDFELLPLTQGSTEIVALQLA